MVEKPMPSQPSSLSHFSITKDYYHSSWPLWVQPALQPGSLQHHLMWCGLLKGVVWQGIGTESRTFYLFLPASGQLSVVSVLVVSYVLVILQAKRFRDWAVKQSKGLRVSKFHCVGLESNWLRLWRGSKWFRTPLINQWDCCSINSCSLSIGYTPRARSVSYLFYRRELKAWINHCDKHSCRHE